VEEYRRRRCSLVDDEAAVDGNGDGDEDEDQLRQGNYDDDLMLQGNHDDDDDDDDDDRQLATGGSSSCGAAGEGSSASGTSVWQRGPSSLPTRPIPFDQRPMITLSGDM
jgi:hypothetical protein